MKKLTIFLICVTLSLTSFAQNNKKTLTFDDILKWNRITEKIISNDGNTIVYKAEPWKGNPVLSIVDKKGTELKTVNSATGAKITSDSKFVVFTIKSTEEEIRELKLKKTKKDRESAIKRLCNQLRRIKKDLLNVEGNQFKSNAYYNKWIKEQKTCCGKIG